MDASDDLVPLLLGHFSQLLGRRLSSRGDLARLPARTLLELADRLPDHFLPALVNLLKGCDGQIFQKMLGEHEEECRELSERFFARFSRTVLEPGVDGNPLDVYLPPQVLCDLAFVSTRQAFFLRQNIEDINAWMNENFGLGPFPADGQTDAWNALWYRLTTA